MGIISSSSDDKTPRNGGGMYGIACFRMVAMGDEDDDLPSKFFLSDSSMGSNRSKYVSDVPLKVLDGDWILKVILDGTDPEPNVAVDEVI